jgi:hypothetical protein
VKRLAALLLASAAVATAAAAYISGLYREPLLTAAAVLAAVNTLFTPRTPREERLRLFHVPLLTSAAAVLALLAASPLRDPRLAAALLAAALALLAYGFYVYYQALKNIFTRRRA